MSNHTPGPWFASGRYIGTFNHKSAIGECRSASECWSDDEPASANARLIAAAPELLEACQTFAEWLRREDEGFPEEIRFNTPEGEAKWREWYGENLRVCALAMEQARSAIAKARGDA